VLSEIESAAERFSLIEKAVSAHREALEERYYSDWTSMGIIEVEMQDLTVTAVESGPLQLQQRLDVEVLPLDGFPVSVDLKYKCKNNQECTGHRSHIIAWEYAQAFRAFKSRYRGNDAACKALEEGLRKRFMDEKRCAYALVGTHSRRPVWMIGQLFFFERDLPPTLF
jgi:hypothetical protein